MFKGSCLGGSEPEWVEVDVDGVRVENVRGFLWGRQRQPRIVKKYFQEKHVRYAAIQNVNCFTLLVIKEVSRS